MKLKAQLKKLCLKHPQIYRLLKGGNCKIKIMGGGNVFINHSLSLKGCTIEISGCNNKIVFEEGVRLTDVRINIVGNGHLLWIKKNSQIKECSRIRIEDYGNQLIIGEHCLINSVFFSLADVNTKILVGSGCLFSAKIVLRTSDGHTILNNLGVRINHAKDIIINNHVWIGYGVNILKGVNIGENSIVGTQSVVTKSIPSNSIACGNPAKIVKTDITWTEERINEQ